MASLAAQERRFALSLLAPALVGQKKPKEALDEAQARITQILKG